ncbi:EF-hand domain-containing protein [Tundrisphaera lichenicola]|uniref:EF-hand domain-containing protein n=1 Tax=Tundrisphaera lichenicola TaxID=2029860 RepID=UPI003EB99F98
MRSRELVFLTILMLSASSAARADDPHPEAGALDLVLQAEGRTALIRLRIATGGVPVPALWDETFAALFRAADRDGDGSLDDVEIGKLPGAFALRQGPPFLNPGIPPSRAALVLDRDGRVDLGVVADYYRREGLGGPILGLGRPSASATLSEALLLRIDQDANGRLDVEEAKGFVPALLALDGNGDELVSPDELARHLPYPGSTGSEYLAAPSAGREPIGVEAASPLLPLPIRRADRHWAAILLDRGDLDGDHRLDVVESGLTAPTFNRLDRSGDRLLDADELAAWPTLPPEILRDLTIDEAAADRFDVEIGRVRLSFRAAEGGLLDWVEAARTRLLTQFAEADADRDRQVEDREAVAPALAEIRRLLPLADRDNDGKLGLEELDAWLDLQRQFARGHVTLIVLDHGSGLFESLDADLDGVLSAREITGGPARLRDSGVIAEDGRIDLDALPRHLVITASRGRPKSPYRPRRPGPAWFLAMDRNGDGDVSGREFNGPSSAFKSLDLDGDGLLDAEESSRPLRSPGPR